MAEFDVHNAVEAVLARKTDSDKAEWERLQKQQREEFSKSVFQPDDPAYQKVQFGIRAVALSKKALMEKGLSDEQRAFEVERMAEGYALQGNYEKAIALSRDPRKTKEYHRTLTALRHPDNKWCSCPRQKGSTFIRERFYYRNRQYVLKACAICGFHNAV